MSILNGSESHAIEEALGLLRAGNVVAFPTETVYGLGADAYNPYAVARIFEAKRRPHFDPLIVHVGEAAWIHDIAETVPPLVSRLIERFWPGPLTVILRKRSHVPGIVTAGLPTVGIRMPSHPVALDLIKRFGHPVAAPSANPFGYMSPTKACHVADALKGRVSLILDGGASVFGIESTIVSVRDDRVVLHRHGAVAVEEIESVAGDVIEKEPGNGVESPGDLPFHYAPLRPLKIIDSSVEIRDRNSGFLAFREPPEPVTSRHLRVLSPTGDLKEAAAKFFSHLIELDREDVNIIYAETIPERGLGRAIMERLRKASRRYAV